MMDVVERIILKKLIESNDYSYIYDDKDVKHNSSKIQSLFNMISTEVRHKFVMAKSEKELKQVWSKMRSRFVKINLKKVHDKSVTDYNEKDFYKNLLFLEDFISHKNDEVYKTFNKKEIMDEVYDKLTGNIYGLY